MALVCNHNFRASGVLCEKRTPDLFFEIVLEGSIMVEGFALDFFELLSYMKHNPYILEHNF